MSVTVELPLIISIIGITVNLMLAVVTISIASGKQSKSDSIILEHRLTVVEEAINNQLKPLYESIEKNFTLFLQKTTTQELDSLLQKYHDDPGGLTMEELLRMKLLINNEMEVVISNESLDRGRAIGLTFLNVAIDDRIRSLIKRVYTEQPKKQKSLYTRLLGIFVRR